MRASSLIQELRGNLPIAALQQFNQDVEESSNPQEIIEDLLYVSPECSEIMRLLRKENITSNELAVILTSFSHILLNIAGELKKYRKTGVFLTQELLHDHIHHFYQLVSPASINKNSRAALQCLTGMVMIGFETATEVLTNLDWKRMNLNILLSRRESGVSRDVRAWCMYFLLAFLNAPDDVTLVKQFLQNAELLPSIFPGLVWDPCETVLNVLKVLMDSVLYNPHVSKTNKVHLFTPTTTIPLLQLYRWVGPTGSLPKKDVELDEELAAKKKKEQEQIRIAAHRLVLTLCTSYKYGIVFKEKVVRQGEIWSNNWAVGKILISLESPWKLEEGKDLLVKAIGYSPDLLKSYLFSIHEILSPRSSNFTSIIDMLIRILEYQKPWRYLAEKGLRGVQVALVPSPLGERFFSILLEAETESSRLCAMSLMKTILSKTSETIKHLETDKSLPRGKFLSMQKYLLGNVHTYLGGVSGVIKCWQRSTGQLPFKRTDGKESKRMSSTELLISIVKVLILCQELFPAHADEEAIHSLNMLQVVRNLTDDNNINDENKAKAVEMKLELQFLCIECLSGSNDRHGMIVDNLSLGGAENQQVEKSMLYQLIMTYSQAKEEVSSFDKETLKAHTFTQKCLDIISNSLIHNGLTVYEGNLSFWLDYIKDNSVQLSAFLTHVIQKTVLSLSEYTDLLIELASSGLQTSYDTSFMKELEEMDVIDNEDISNINSTLPFSRLVPAAVELLTANPDSDCIQYFSKVVSDYLHTLNNPVYLADFLLDKENTLTPELKQYLKYWSQGKLSSKAKTQILRENDSLADILKHVFMSRDWSSVEASLETENLQLLMKDKNIILTAQQVLVYLDKELSEDNKSSKSKLTKKFVYVLKNMSAVLEENDQSQSKKLIQTILEYHSILSNYQPFSSTKKNSVSSLAHTFISLVLSKYPDLAPVTSPYYDKLLKDIKMHLLRQDEKVDFLSPVMPYISSEHILLSYAQVEDLFILCLKSSCTDSVSLNNLLLELLKFLSQITSAKRKPKVQSVNLMLVKYLEWSQQGEEPGDEKKQIMEFLEKLLMEVLTAEEVKQLCSDDLKSLLHSSPPSSNLCCRILKLHPPHAVVFAKKLKKHKSLRPSHAALLASLADQEESVHTAVVILRDLVEDLKSWALTMEEEKEGYSKLFNCALKFEILDQESLVEVCKNLYEKIVTRKEAPPREYLSLVPAFKKIADTGAKHKALPLGVNLTLLHICLSSIRTLFKTEDTELLKDTTQVVNDILPSINPSSLRNSLLDSKLWPAYVKQVLRHSFNNRTLGPSLLHTLDLLFAIMFSEEKGNEIALPSHTVYQMIFSHSHYLELMFNRETDWDQLKEKVIAVQQTLVNCNIKVCEERHVPILLGAYGASMSAVDQRILKLLFTYEQNGFMDTIQPILWGEAAIAHFGVQSSDNNLWNDPKPQQALALLDKDKILKTCNKFDTSLPLEPQGVQSVDPSIYDIRFLLSLMTYLANHEEVGSLDYAECGAVAVGFALMTSHSDAMWGAGAALLRFMVERMEDTTRRVRLRLPWLWLVGVVSCTFDGVKRRLPPLTTQFLIRSSLLISQPSHRMYQPVMNYLFLKPAFDLNEIPELFRFYNSDSIKDHYVQRSFLLSMLSTGIRENVDYIICKRRSVTTMVMGMLQAPSIDSHLRVQVLEVLESLMHILPAAVDLVKYHNLLTVLPLVVLPTTSQDAQISELLKEVLNVLSAIWTTITKSVTDGKRKRKREDETDLPSSKIAKKEYTNEDSGVDDLEPDREDTNLDDFEEQPISKRIVPPLFVREFLNCLSLLTPVAVTCDSPETIAQHLELLTENVKYVETVAELSAKNLIRTAALAPEIIKGQVYENINWDTILGHLQGRITDEEEVKLLGAKAEDMKNRWATEPLSKCLKKPTSTEEENEPSNEDGLMRLRSSVNQLLCTLGK